MIEDFIEENRRLRQRVEELEKALLPKNKSEDDGSEKERTNREEMFHALFESTLDGIFLTQPDGRIDAVNPAACRLLGMTEEEIICAGRARLINLKDPRVALALEERARNGRVNGEVTFLRRNGTAFPVEYNSVIYRDSRGESRAVTIFRDRTDLMLAREALRESEEKYRHLFEAGSDAILLIDKETGKIVDANVAAEKLYGYSREELLAMKAGEVSSEPDMACQAGQKLMWQDPICFHRRKDGRVFPVEVKTSYTTWKDRELQIAAVRDITERKGTEEALRESEEKYRIVFNNPIYAICIFDLETLQLLDVNDAYVAMYGYSREELLSGMTIHDITAEHESSDAATQRAIRDGTIFLPLRYHRKKDGMIFPVEIVGGPYLWKGRKVMFALAHDITERKLAEAALWRSQQLFADIFRVSPAATILSSLADGRCVDANEAYARLTGYTREELIGKTAVELNIWLSAEERQRVVTELAQKGHLENVELTLRRKNGEFITTLSAGEVITLDGQRFILSFFFDMTEQKRAEQALKESERRYRLLAENARDVIWTMDWPSLRLTYLSPGIAHLRGYTVEEARVQTLEKTLTPKSYARVREAYAEEISEEQKGSRDLARTRTMELEYRCKDGSTAWGESKITSIRDVQGKVVEILGVARNITERKAAETALRQRTLELQELNRTLETRVHERTEELAKANEALRHLSSRLLSVQEDERKRIAQDLHDQCGKNLTALRFGLEKLINAKPVETQPRGAFDDVMGLIGQLGDDIRNIASDLRPDTLDHLGLIPTLEWYIKNLSNRVPKIHFDLQVGGFKKRLRPEAEIVLYRVIQEGLTNVLKHAGAQNVKILLTYSHPRVILTMRDDGKGFEEKRVLSPSRIGKRGIGLLGIRERVSSLGGTISILSEKGKGTLLRVELPALERKKDAKNKGFNR